MGSAGPSTKEVLLDAVTETLGKDRLAIIEPVEHPTDIDAGDKTDKLEYAPTCITQMPRPIALIGAPVDIMVGMNSEVPRWQPGSTIKWSAWRHGYKTQDLANHAWAHMDIATQKWNEIDIGVKFEHTPLAKDACFVLCHGGDYGNVLASAFFPNGDDLNYVYTYDAGFRDSWKNNLWMVLTHELGHVLGLRHEFALEKETNKRAEQLGERDEYSVMNYRSEPPRITEQDRTSTKAFYDMKEGDMIGKTAIKDYVPA